MAATLLVLALLPLVAAQQTVNVSSADARIIYVGTWIPQDNGGHVFALNQDASLSFTFQGTALSYLSVHNSNGGIATVSLDGGSSEQVDESAGTQKGDPAVEAYLWSKSGLDGTQNHTFVLNTTGTGQYGGGYVEVYGFSYVEATDASTSSSSSASSSSSSATSSSSSTPAPSHASNSSTSRAALIGGVVGGLLGGAVAGAVLFFLLLAHRRRERARREEQRTGDEQRPRPATLGAPLSPSPYAPSEPSSFTRGISTLSRLTRGRSETVASGSDGTLLTDRKVPLPSPDTTTAPTLPHSPAHAPAMSYADTSSAPTPEPGPAPQMSELAPAPAPQTSDVRRLPLPPNPDDARSVISYTGDDPRGRPPTYLPPPPEYGAR